MRRRDLPQSFLLLANLEPLEASGGGGDESNIVRVRRRRCLIGHEGVLARAAPLVNDERMYRRDVCILE